MSSRWVRVDNTDSGIDYQGGWTSTDAQDFDTRGNFGRVYRSSLQSVTGQASLSYTFNGGSGRIYGTTNLRESSGVFDPTWGCSLDGQTVPITNPFPYPMNNWLFCEWETGMGEHTITLTVQSNSRAFNFDYLDYAPSDSADVTNGDILLRWSDPSIQFGSSGWQAFGDGLGRMAASSGAEVTIQFYGTSVTWYGTTPRELPSPPAPATYRIDDGPETSFTVPGDHGGQTKFNTAVFKTNSVELGHHTLRVVSGGTTQMTPLILGSLIVENGSLRPPSRLSDSTTTTGNSPSDGSPGQSGGTSVVRITTTQTDTARLPSQTDAVHPGNVSPDSSAGGSGGNTSSNVQVGASSSGPSPGAIAGIVVGIVGLIVLGVLAFLCHRRRKRRALRAKQTQDFNPASPAPFADRTTPMVQFSGNLSTPLGRGDGQPRNPFTDGAPPPTSRTIPSFYPEPVSPVSSGNGNGNSMYYPSDFQSVSAYSTTPTTTSGGLSSNEQNSLLQPMRTLPPSKLNQAPREVNRYDNLYGEEQPPQYSPS